MASSFVYKNLFISKQITYNISNLGSFFNIFWKITRGISVLMQAHNTVESNENKRDLQLIVDADIQEGTHSPVRGQEYSTEQCFSLSHLEYCHGTQIAGTLVLPDRHNSPTFKLQAFEAQPLLSVCQGTL
jgi:hypothetical protein